MQQRVSKRGSVPSITGIFTTLVVNFNMNIQTDELRVDFLDPKEVSQRAVAGGSTGEFLSWSPVRDLWRLRGEPEHRVT